jgi:GNAT superfamily N-acetyltransferase
VRRVVGYILGFYVKQSYRRKGFGKQLMEKTLLEFGNKGCHKTRLEVFAHSERQLSSLDILASNKKLSSIRMKRRNMRRY